MAYIYGMDLSHWDGTVVWTEVPAYIRFAFIKISEASRGNYLYYKDGLAWQHWLGAGQNKIYRGPYHFWRYYGGTGAAQAQTFYDDWRDACDDAGCEPKLELPPVLDLEDTKAPKFASDIKYKIRDCLDNIHRLFGVQSIIYTAKWYTDGWIGDCSWLAAYINWLAQYTYNPSGAPTFLPKGITAWNFWQYTDKAEIPGIPAEDECMDAFHGTIEQLQAMLITKPGLSLEAKVALLWDEYLERHGG